MKKILLVALAAVGMAACVQNEELAVSNGNAIKFDNVYVDNATKTAIDGSYTAAKGNLDHFNVWATIGNGGVSTNIFENLAVTKVNGAWTYDASLTQYWIPGNYYEFVGVVDGTVATTTDDCKLPVTISTNLENQKDVLYAWAERNYTANSTPEAVHLNFKHLLAKIKFEVQNTIPAEMSEYTYTVESIDIQNADKNGVYTITDRKTGAGEWVADDDYVAEYGCATNDNTTVANLAIGDSAESNYEYLVLPQNDKELHIKVKYTIHKGNWSTEFTKNVVTTLDIEQNKAYKFILALGAPGAAIEFDAEVKGWELPTDLPIEESTVVTSTAAELKEALTGDASVIVLENDINLDDLVSRAADDVTLTVAADKTFTINLNGYKLSATSTQSGNREMFLVKGNLTIKNGTIEYEHVGENMGWSAMTTIFDITAGGVVNLDGVTAKNLGGSDMAFVAHLNNWGEVTLNVENSTLESNYVAVRVFNSGYDKNNVAIHNSTLKGGNYAFWVHNYTAADLGSKFEAHKALLNFDIFNGTNTFVGKNNTPIRFGMTNSLYFGVVSTEAEFAEILAAGWSVILANDIVLEEPLKLANENNAVINLNGHTISATDSATGSYGLITNQGNLNVVGPGKLAVKATNNRGWNAYSSVISNTVGGNLVVEGGVVIEHLGGTDMAYGIDNLTNGKGTSAVTTIKNATVKSTYRAVRQFLNGIEATNELYVKAGAVVEGANKSIWMQDPSKNANTGKLVVETGAQLKGDVYLYVTAGSTTWPVEVSIASAALVGESKVLTGNVPFGYEVVEENGTWVVVEHVVANSNESLKEALSGDAAVVAVAAGEYTFPTGSIKAGVTLQCAEGTVFTGTSSLNIKGATVVGATFKNEGGQAVSGTIYGNFKNCTFEGKETIRWCYTTAGETTVFENCVVKTTLRGVHFDGMNGDVIFKNCEINGFNAYSGSGNITFEGCTFGCDASGYNGLNIYSNTVLTNCNFVYLSSKTNFIDMEGTDKTLTITNCTATLDGAAADVKTFIGGSKLANNTVVVDGVTL